MKMCGELKTKRGEDWIRILLRIAAMRKDGKQKNGFCILKNQYLEIHQIRKIQIQVVLIEERIKATDIVIINGDRFEFWNNLFAILFHPFQKTIVIFHCG